MAIDASIPLSVKSPKFATPADAVSLQNLLAQTQFNQTRASEAQRENQNAISLKDFLSTNPGAIDSGTGMLTPEGMKGVYGIDPMTGMKMQQANNQQGMLLSQLQSQGLQRQVNQNQLDKDLEERLNKAHVSESNAAVSAFDLAKKAKADDATAMEAAQKARQTQIDQNVNSGLLRGLTPEQIAQGREKPIDIDALRAQVTSPKEVFAEQKADKAAARAEETPLMKEMRAAGIVEGSKEWNKRLKQHMDRIDAPTQNMLLNDVSGDGQNLAGLSGDSLLSKLPPETSALVKGIAENNIDPKSLSNIGGHRERILGLVMQYKPDYSQASFSQTDKAVKDFNTGKQGQAVRSFNVALEHLDTLEQLGSALNNGNVQLLNKASNMWKTQTGQAAPTNFDAAKQIVSQEVVKAIVTNGGGQAERQEAENKVSAASSPAQLGGVIDTYKRLFAGQLKGLQQQYESSTKKDDFRSRLLTETGREAIKQYGDAEVEVKKYNPSGKDGNIFSNDNKSSSQQDWTDADEKRLQELEKKHGTQ